MSENSNQRNGESIAHICSRKGAWINLSNAAGSPLPRPKCTMPKSTPVLLASVTRCVTLSDMSRARQFSARLDAAIIERLERRGARSGLNKSRLAERYIDEGVRMDDHPGIVFRDGPTGRRPGLAAGPDLWEVIGGLRSTGLEGDEAIRATAEWSGLSVRQVRDAIGYYSEYPAEIDERIRLNEEEADAAERRWREQSLTR
jgi:hypothetical protein